MLRPYDKNDQKIIINIFQKNIPQFFAQEELSDLIQYLEKNYETYQTINYNHKIVGGVGCITDEINLTGKITWIFIDPDYAGLGLGRTTIDQCLTSLKSNKNLKKIAVRTSQYAHHFFEKFDFKTTYFEQNYWSQGFDLYEMELLIE